MAEGIGTFGDARRAARGAWLYDRIVATGSLVLRQVGGDRAGEIAAHRFLSAPEVTVSEIVETLGARTAGQCAGRRVLAVQDTTEINFAGRAGARVGLGPGGDGATPGFFIHALVAVDAAAEAVVGLLDAQIWTRRAGKVGTARRERPLEAKESRRWLTAGERAAALLSEAAQVILVGDRESDIYGLFARRPAGQEFLVRAAQDRALDGGRRLFAAAAAWPVLGVRQLPLLGRRAGEKGRVAEVEVRAGRVAVQRPRPGRGERLPATLELTLVEVRERRAPKGAAPVHWRLVTSLPCVSLAEAEEIVRLYRLRWRIEQVFRALKSDGLDLAAVQMHAAKRLFKLAAIALGAAVRTLQLVDARAGSRRPATDVIDAALLPAAAAIARTVEGKTARQKNPHPEGSLGWLAWIIARLGGWNCYYKPPGPKTIRAGWDRFAAMAAGFLLALAPTAPLRRGFGRLHPVYEHTPINA